MKFSSYNENFLMVIVYLIRYANYLAHEAILFFYSGFSFPANDISIHKLGYEY